MPRRERIERVQLTQKDYDRYFNHPKNAKIKQDRETEKEMRAYITNLVTIANKRTKRLKNAKQKGTIEFSTALDYMNSQRLTRFSVKGKSTEELRQTYIQVAHFLNMRSSTVSEAKKMETEAYQHFNEFVIKNVVGDGAYTKNKLSKKEFNQYRRIQEEMRNLYPDKFIQGSPVNMTEKIIQTMKQNKSSSTEELMNKVQKLYEEDYLKRISENDFTRI